MDNDSEFWLGAKYSVFKIDDYIYQGAFPNDESCIYLKKIGISDILNVSGGTSSSCIGINCQSVPFPDGKRIPIECITKSLLFINNAVVSQRKIFVHCSAGQNRSATIIWLYYLSVTKNSDYSFSKFIGKTLDAVPGHPKLVGDDEIRFALNYKY